MQTDSSLPSSDANRPTDDHLLEELAALTGLFSPEVLWHTEEKLDELTEQEELAKKAKPALNPDIPTSL
ncbi:MAG: hypothetical protein EOO62_22675 [Hymenobacter sp.]|nr:MAG: hypothetical protein EOO62_22675 [Hymenobacter sp.]